MSLPLAIAVLTRPWTRLLAAAVTLGLALSLAIAQPAVTIVDNPSSGLRTWEVGAGHRPLVLLHGYASTPQHWLPFTETIRLPRTWRFVLPQAPEPTPPPDGPIDGRAWWRLALSTYVRPGQALPDFSRAQPAGLRRSSDRVRTLLAEVDARLGSPADRLVLGGFSQGAMVAADIAFRSDRPIAALVLLSPTFVDEAAWTAGMPRRRGVPVLIAHGRRDTILDVAASERLSRAMRDAGLRVTWLPFDDGHEIPAAVVDGVNQFLATIGDD
jgi:phospholipase/carboxylesterase